MEVKIDKLLKQSIEFSKTLKKNEISLLEILINETGMLLSGKLIHQVTYTQLIWNNLKDTFRSKVRVKLPEILTSAETIIFATEPTHLKQTIPVFNYLKKELLVCFVVTKLSLYNELKKLSVPVFFLDSSIKPFTEEIRNKLNLAVPDSQLLSDFHDVRLYLKKRSNSIRALIDYFEMLTVQSSLKGVLIGNDTTSQGKALTLVCQRKKIPTYAIQHGLITNDWTHRVHSVDTFFTFGQKSKDILVENGMDQEKIIISGAPYLDSFKSADYSKSTIKPSILILLSGYGHGTSVKHYQDILSMLFQFFSVNAELTFVIKPHRKENKEIYKERITKLNLQNVTVINEDARKTVFDYIAESSLVITGNSYTALESMLLNKPVISIDLNNEYSNIDFISEGVVFKVTTFEMLTTTVKNVYELYRNNEKIRKKILEQYFYRNDGNAAFRISAYICPQLN